MHGRVTLLFVNACFALLRLPETALVDGHYWSLSPYIRLIILFLGEENTIIHIFVLLKYSGLEIKRQKFKQKNLRQKFFGDF